MRRVSLLLTAVLLVAVSLPAEGARRPFLTDRVGDANLLNDQKIGLPLPPTSTAPVNVGKADITRVTVATLFKGSGRHRHPAGTQVTMQVAEPPSDGVMYEVVADWRGTCDGFRSSLSMYLLLDRQLTVGAATCQSPDGSSSNDVLEDFSVDPAARTVTWRTRATMPRGAEIVAVDADTCVFAVGVFDTAHADGSWVYGR